MATGKAFKLEVIKEVRNRLTAESFAKVKASGILDSFSYCDVAFESDNASDIIRAYESKTGQKLKRF